MTVDIQTTIHLSGKTTAGRDTKPETVIELTGRPVAIIDCFCLLNDNDIHRYFELGCEVKGLGRGHIKRIKDEVR